MKKIGMLVMYTPGIKMKVCLVHPRLYVKAYNFFPLGLGYIAASLDNNSIPFSFYDLHRDWIKISDFIKAAKSEEPGLFAISCLMNSFKNTVRLCEAIKENFPSAKIVLGGKISLLEPEFIFKHIKTDYVIKGEGEIAILELIEMLDGKKDIKTVQGLMYKDEHSIVCFNGETATIENINDYMIPLEKFDMEKYVSKQTVQSPNILSVNMLSSRGCPFSCLVKETKIKMKDNTEKNIQDIEIGDEIASYNSGKYIKNKVIDTRCIKSADLYEITTELGKKMIVTGDHTIYVKRNKEKKWIMVKHIQMGDKVLTNGNISNIFPYGNKNPSKRLEIRKKIIESKIGKKNPMWKPKISLLTMFKWERITSIKKLDKEEEVYDIECESTHNFFANNILVHNCDFCNNSKSYDKRMRYYDLEKMGKQWDYMIKTFGLKHITFNDDIFTVNRKRTKEVCNLLKSKDLSFSCSTRLDCLDEEIINLLDASGCKYICIGIESPAPAVAKVIDKRLDFEKCEKNIGLLKKTSIIVNFGFMIGHYGETEETIQQTREFVMKHRIVYVSFFATPFPGTRLYDMVRNRIKNEEEYLYKLSEADLSAHYLVNMTDIPTKRIYKLRDCLVADSLLNSLEFNIPFKRVIRWTSILYLRFMRKYGLKIGIFKKIFEYVNMTIKPITQRETNL